MSKQGNFHDIVREIKDRLPIRDFLQERGKTVTDGLLIPSPFREEKNPSFAVFDDEQRFYDFGDPDKRGDIFDLYSFLTGVNLKQSFRELSDRFSISLSGDGRSAEHFEAERNERQRILEVYQVFQDFCIKSLHNSPEMQQFCLKKWGFTPELCEKYKVGYCTREVYRNLRKHFKCNHDDGSLDDTRLAEAGLLQWYDDSIRSNLTFLERIIFPYPDPYGAPIYFIGRATEKTPIAKGRSKPAKYHKVLTRGGNNKQVGITVINPLLDLRSTKDISTGNILYIGEGITDAESIHYITGERVISAVTKQPKKNDFPQIISIARQYDAKGRIVIVPDNEKNGEGLKGAISTYRALRGAGIKNLFLLELPRQSDSDKIDANDFLRERDHDPKEFLELPQHKLHELLAKNLTPDQVKHLEDHIEPIFREVIAEYGDGTNEIKATGLLRDVLSLDETQIRPYMKIFERLEQERNNLEIGTEILEVQDFKILGFTTSREVLLWYKGHLHFISSRPLKSELNFFCKIENEKTCNAIAKAVFAAARDRGQIDSVQTFGPGVWSLKDDRWLIVSGKKAVTVGPEGIGELQEPVIDGRIVSLSGKSWLDWPTFMNSYGKDSLQAIYQEIQKIVSQWCWISSDISDYVSAFVLLSPFQACMTWRPWLHLTGARNSGKTFFFERVLEPLYGALIARMDKTTAHAIAQSIGNTGRIPLLDEFERSPKIAEVLNLMKLTNRGGTKTSGTPGENAKEFEIHHLFWLNSIYMPAEVNSDAANQSRMICFELQKKADSVSPIGLTTTEGLKVAARLVSAMISSWKEIEDGAQEAIRRKNDIIQKFEGSIDDRTVENFCYAMALLNKATGREYGIPSWTTTDIEDDGEKVLRAILYSTVASRNAFEPRCTVSRAIQSVILTRDKIFTTAIQDVGLSITRPKEEKKRYLAICPDQVKRKLLHDTEFASLSISDVLNRLKGALKNRTVSLGKTKAKCILIPIEHLNLEGVKEMDDSEMDEED